MSYIPGVWILWPQNNERCSSIQTHLQITPSTCTFTCLCQMSIYFTAVHVRTEIHNLNLGSHIQQTSTWTCRWYWQRTHPCAKGKSCIPWRNMEGMEVPQYAFLILALDARWVVTFTLQPFYLLVPLELAAGWNPAPVWILWEKWNLLPAWNQTIPWLSNPQPSPYTSYTVPAPVTLCKWT